MRLKGSEQIFAERDPRHVGLRQIGGGGYRTLV
jgi:hypothetical protein